MAKNAEIAVFRRMHTKCSYFLKMCFYFISEEFLIRNQKKFRGVKIIKYEKPSILKRHLYQNAKAQNMPEVAGCLVEHYLNSYGLVFYHERDKGQ